MHLCYERESVRELREARSDREADNMSAYVDLNDV